MKELATEDRISPSQPRASLCRLCVPLWLKICLALPLAMALGVTAACTRASSSSSSSAPTKSESFALAAALLQAASDSAPLPHIDAKRAFEYTREVTAFGPRYIGSENHRKLERYIANHLKGDAVRNIIAKFPGAKDGVIVIMGHYDTNYPLRNIGYVGANDGGSSTAILLEFANQFRGKKRDGYSVWLVWSDGEEAVRRWSDTDSDYGSRHLAERWEKDGTLKKIKALMVMDMIGDADLDILRDTNSAAWLLDLIYSAAERGGYQSHFYANQGGVEDDHLPFVKRGVPCADVIDLDYGYNNVFHHTAQDTMDKLSPKSLEIVGNTIMETIRLLDQR
jgi:glutaminyl-peptide cyclotransferase